MTVLLALLCNARYFCCWNIVVENDLKVFFLKKKTILVSLSIISEWLTHISRFYIFIQNKNDMKTKNPLLSHKLIQIKQYGWEIWYVFIVSSSAVSKSLNNRRYHVMSVNKFYCSVLYEITSFIIDKRFMQYGFTNNNFVCLPNI